ncbi:MAG: hypothetical protein R3B70_25110 [Polyangiaceae bacterium]
MSPSPRVPFLAAFSSIVSALALAGCLEASPAAPDVPEWKRPRAAAAELSDTSLAGQPVSVEDRFGDPFWSACYKDFRPTEGPSADLQRLALSCAAPRGLRATSPLHNATQKAEDRAERLVLRVRKGRCYRLFAVADAGIRDLDVSVLAPDGRLVAADVSKDPWSVVPPRGPWCPDEEGPFAVDVSVADGEGSYVVGLWGSPIE